MPELPDIVVYIEALEQRIQGQTLERVQIASPFLLRTAVPSITNVEGMKVVELRRLGKRICIGLEEDLWLVLHLMIAGRLHWSDRVSSVVESPMSNVQGQLNTGSAGGSPADRGNSRTVKERVPSRGSKNRLAAFQFTNGILSLTEAGSKRRASLHLVTGDAGLERLDPGGLEILGIDATDFADFAKVLTSANHTLKRALTDPRLFSGIGNAYSDEILFAARLSPIALTHKLTSEEIERLFDATRDTLLKWIEILRADVAVGLPGDVTQTVSLRTRASSPTVRENTIKVQAKKADAFRPIAFPEQVTAFREGMAVHGRYQQPCPRCGNKIQRIRYASNETNYCPKCQTAGKLLADRALSRLLRADWPRTAEELEGLTRTPGN